MSGKDSAQGPYKLDQVEFLDNGFITPATGSDVWDEKLGGTYLHLKKLVRGNFASIYTLQEHTTKPATAWSTATNNLPVLLPVDGVSPIRPPSSPTLVLRGYPEPVWIP